MTHEQQSAQSLDLDARSPILRLYIPADHPDDADREVAHLHLPGGFDAAQVTAQLGAILPSLLGQMVFSPERSLRVTASGEFTWNVAEGDRRFTVTGDVITPLPLSTLLSGAHEAWGRDEVRQNPALVGGEDSQTYFQIVQLSTDICRHCGQEFEVPRRASSPLPEPCLAAR